MGMLMDGNSMDSKMGMALKFEFDLKLGSRSLGLPDFLKG